MITAEDRDKIIREFLDSELFVSDILENTKINVGVMAEMILDKLFGKVQAVTLDVQDLHFKVRGDCNG